jgi:glycosyltransferase involved in cell wall biosynthesis
MAEGIYGAGLRTASLIKELTLGGPQHHWLLLSNREIAGLPTGDHIETLVFGNTLRNAVALKWWYDHTLPEKLRKLNVDVLVGLGGVISNKRVVPQIMLLHNWLEYPGGFEKGLHGNGWFKKRMRPMLEKADAVLLDYKERPGLEGFLDKQESKWKETGWFGKVNGPDAVTENTNSLKQQLTGGKEYFFCEAGWQNQEQGLALLLAYAAFKKRMQSGIQLVLLGSPSNPEAWQKKLASFRFKTDVSVISPGTFPRITLLTSAFANIYLPDHEALSPLIDSMQAGAPLIAEPYPVFTTVAGESILFTGKEPGESLSDRMMQIYRDDAEREKRRRQAMDKSKALTLQNTTGNLLKLIEDGF